MYRNLILESSCELLSHDAYFFALYLPECLDYMDAVNIFVQHLNPCKFVLYGL